MSDEEKETPETPDPNLNMRCCFNEMIPDVVNTLPTPFDRVKYVCTECRMVWVISRLQDSMLFSPLGRMPVIEIAKKLPEDLH